MGTQRRLTRAARLRQLYTGQPVQSAHQAIRSGASDGIAPAKSNGQALIESQILERLGSSGSYWAHPLGICGTWPRRDGLVVALDSHTVLHRGDSFGMSEHAVQSLLPAREADGSIIGVPGLRVLAVVDRDLRLTQLDGDGQVVLRGAPGTDWDDILARHRHDDERDGVTPLWTDPRMTMPEQRDAYSVGSGRQLAWLGSGLLRRVALFHSFTNANSVATWITGDRWTFALEVVRSVPLDHGLIVDRLRDSVWGMSVQVVDTRCNCDFGDGQRESSCAIDLKDAGGQRGTLHLRFRWAGDTDSEVRERYRRVGAHPAWLDRVLPVAAGSTGGR
jgi:hypothetical protein